MTRKTMVAFSLAALALSTSACNTVKGLGEDLQSVGQTGEEVINGESDD